MENEQEIKYDRRMNEKQEFELISNATGIQMKAWGKTVKELFRNALRGTAMFLKPTGLAAAEKAKKIKHAIRVEAIDINTLLIEFVSHVLALSDIHNMIFTNIIFKTIGENFLEAELFGIATDGFDQEIKAVSYHDIDIKRNQTSGLYETTLVFDV